MTIVTGRFEKGLSLIELLVVVAIMAAAAGMIVSLTGKMDDRNRYEMTAKKLGEIRSAILGPDVVSPDGQLMTGGYLQDVGWPPYAETDLCEKPINVAAMKYYPQWQTWAGWRGPYLTPGPKRKVTDDAITVPPPYDDYGNNFHNWPAQTLSTAWWLANLDASDNSLDFNVCSYGSDGLAGGTGVFEADYPQTGSPALIPKSQWLTEIPSGTIVRIINSTSVAFNNVDCKLRIVVPRWNNPSDPFDPDSDPLISDQFVLNVAAYDASSSAPLPFHEKTLGKNMWTPNGKRMIFLVDSANNPTITTTDGTFQACAELPITSRVCLPSIINLYIRKK